MNFVGKEGIKLVNRIAEHAGMRIDLVWIDVLERKRILGHVRGIRIAPNPEVIILRQPKELKRCITSFRIRSTQIVSRLPQQREGIKIRPALAHPTTLRIAKVDAHSPADQAIA